MSGYLIAFISAVVLSVALIAVSKYNENCRGKRYEVIGGVSEFFEAFVMLTFGWWFLERFFSGDDSGFGWWILAMATGAAISILISFATRRVCERIWFKKEFAYMTTVKMGKGLKTAICILTFAICAGFTVCFAYGLFANKFDGVGEKIMAVLVIALLGFGSYDRMKRITRLHKK